MIEGPAQTGLVYFNGAIWSLLALGLAFRGEFDSDFFVLTGLAMGYLVAGALSARGHFWPATIPWIGAGLFFVSKSLEHADGDGWGVFEGLPFLLLVLSYFVAGAALSIYLAIDARNR
ncbi:MAG: hypothetical protein JSR60_08835 [Proteobacteria bacterium]|nr:hypothetical protein [Pseudomonadota bacterium]